MLPALPVVMTNPVFVKLLHYFERKYNKYAKRIPTNALISNLMGNYERAFGSYEQTGVPPETLSTHLGEPPSVQKALYFGIEKSLLLSKPWPIQWIVLKWQKLKQKLGIYGETQLIRDYKAAEICLTQMVEEAESSDQIHGIYKSHTTLLLREPRDPNEPREKFLKTEIDKSLLLSMKQVGDPKIENAKKKVLFNGKDLPAQYNTRKIAFDKMFKEKIGADFDEVRTILMAFNHERPFILREHMVINKISEQFGFSKEVVKRVVEGLVISKAKLLKGGAPVWKLTRQKNRITRKPIARMRLWDSYNYLGWSPVMLREILNHFSELMIYGELPDEWLIDDEIKTEAEKLSLEVSTWFENEFIRLMSERGFFGREIKKDKIIGNGNAVIKYPRGQIDFLGFNSDLQLLVVAECKLVKWSADAGDENGDYREFIRDYDKPHQKTHFDKLVSKYEWVCANLTGLMPALKKEYPEISYRNSIRVASLMITYHPMRISVFADIIPLRSIVRFIEDFDEKRDWPYNFGIKEIKLM